jgi:hypothetical protein
LMFTGNIAYWARGTSTEKAHAWLLGR